MAMPSWMISDALSSSPRPSRASYQGTTRGVAGTVMAPTVQRGLAAVDARLVHTCGLFKN